MKTIVLVATMGALFGCTGQEAKEHGEWLVKECKEKGNKLSVTVGVGRFGEYAEITCQER